MTVNPTSLGPMFQSLDEEIEFFPLAPASSPPQAHAPQDVEMELNEPVPVKIEELATPPALTETVAAEPIQDAVKLPPPLPNLNPVEKFYITHLKDYLIKEVQVIIIANSMSPQWGEQFRKELTHRLDLTTSILNPPKELQFLRHLAKEVLSLKSSFAWSFDTPPKHLPLPLSQSWIPQHPYTVHIPNPALRALFLGVLDENEYQNLYINLLSTSIPLLLKGRHPQIITFQQLHTSYEFIFPLCNLVPLFFPRFIAQFAYNLSEENCNTLSDVVFLSYKFLMRDQRLATSLVGETRMIESFIASNVLSLFPSSWLHLPLYRKNLMGYLSFLLQHGVIGSEMTFSTDILQSIFTLISQLLEGTSPPYAENICESGFYNLVFHACQNPQVLQVGLQFPYFQKHIPLPTPIGSVNMSYQHLKPENSFLIRNLRVSWDRQKESTAPSEVQSKLEENQLLVEPDLPSKKEPKLSPELFEKKEFFHYFIRHINPMDVKLTLSHLQLIPEIDEQLLAESYPTWRYGYSQSRYQPHFIARDYIRNILESKLEDTSYFSSKIKLVAQNFLSRSLLEQEKHPSNQAFIDFRDRLNLLIKTPDTPDALAKAVARCFYLPGLHAGMSLYRPVFYLLFLFAGHLAAIRPK